MKKLDQLRRLDLLVLDDLGLEALRHNALIDLLNILEDRVGRKSTIVAAQMRSPNGMSIWAATRLPTPSRIGSSTPARKSNLKGESLGAKKKA